MILRALAACWLLLAASAAAAQAVPWSLAEARARHAVPTSQFRTLDGVSLHYRDEGQGPAVLLVHGSYGDVADWDGWARHLLPRFRIIRLDMPGFGLTGPVPSGDYSADQTMRLMRALMDQLGIARFALVGTSSGGPPAFRFAAANPERVSALIIMNSAGIVAGSAGSRPNQPGFGELTLNDITAERLKGPLKTLTNDSPAVTPDFIARKADIARIAGRLEEGSRIVRQYQRGDPLAVLNRIKAPTLVLWGGANKALAGSVAEDFARGLAAAPIVWRQVIPDGAHLLHIQQPDKSGEIARHFLERWAR